MNGSYMTRQPWRSRFELDMATEIARLLSQRCLSRRQRATGCLAADIAQLVGQLAPEATMKTCDRCGVALSAGLGGSPRRLMLVADNGQCTSVELCGQDYRETLRAALEALLAPEGRREMGAPVAS